MNIFEYLFIIFLTIHVVTALIVIVKLFKSVLFTKKQKTYNTILIFAIPFIWSVLIYYMLRKEPYSYQIEPKNDISSNSFHESEKGFIG